MEGKSNATIEKYIRDVTKFYHFLNGANITKELAIEFKRVKFNYLPLHILLTGYGEWTPYFYGKKVEYSKQKS